jgi:hypothetical protein
VVRVVVDGFLPLSWIVTHSGPFSLSAQNRHLEQTGRQVETVG